MGKVRQVRQSGSKEGIWNGVGPNGWAAENRNDRGHRGYQFGFSGLGIGTVGDKHGLHGTDDILTGGGFIGLGADGQYGLGLGGKVAGGSIGYGQPGDGLHGGADVDAFGADAHAWLNPEKGASAGASAYFVQGSVNAGNIGSGNRDRHGRFGLAAGVGAAGRLHWADEDGDGLREYGFGADIGPFSFDVKSEDPLRDFIPGMSAVGSVMDLFGYEGNMTQDAGNALSSAWDTVSSGASSAWDSVSSGASALWSAATGW